MNTLFDIGPELPEGFYYTSDFITETEESNLLDAISTIELGAMKFHQYEARRRVASFGHGWSFTEHKLKKANEIPKSFDFLIDKVSHHLQVKTQALAQLLVTEYPVGSVINWHRDAPPFDIIAGVSLLSDCIFRLRPHDKEKQQRNATISLPVQRRSLYSMQGIAREAWQHSTMPVKKVRYSLTFRTLKK